MGMYDTVLIEDGVELPEFPADGDPQDLEWQTKDIGYPAMETYKITADGRLLRMERTYREMTTDELDERAQEEGYESWDAWEAADTGPLDPPLESWKRTVDDEWWADHNMHGSFEFHASGNRVDGYDDFYWSYEARFTRGDLDKIVYLGERFGDSSSPSE